jgi:hypothetical protein
VGRVKVQKRRRRPDAGQARAQPPGETARAAGEKKGCPGEQLCKRSPVTGKNARGGHALRAAAQENWLVLAGGQT